MNLLQDAPACAGTNSNLCDVVYRLTGNASIAAGSGWLIAKPLAIVGLVLLAFVARWLLHRLVDRIVRRAGAGVVPGPLARRRLGRVRGEPVPQSGAPTAAQAASPGSAEGPSAVATAPPPETDAAAAERRTQRARTVGSLLKSIITATVFTLLVIMVIAELGYNVGPLIAGAGVIGVALGFGAQTLVRDFLSGLFLIFEDQCGVGDVVDLGEATGTVEAVSLRVTRLRDEAGTVWYVRNGEILRLGNLSRGEAGSAT